MRLVALESLSDPAARKWSMSSALAKHAVYAISLAIAALPLQAPSMPFSPAFGGDFGRKPRSTSPLLSAVVNLADTRSGPPTRGMAHAMHRKRGLPGVDRKKSGGDGLVESGWGEENRRDGVKTPRQARSWC